MIKQAKFSQSLKFFQDGFLQRWGLRPYNNKQDSCFFYGIYSQEDVNVINNHRGLKIVYHPVWSREVVKNLNPENVVVRICSEVETDRRDNPTPWNEYYFSLKNKRVNFELKDFSLFHPSEFGDKIYCYIGNEQVKKRYGYDLAEKVRRAGYKVIYGMPRRYSQGELKKVYDQCFINLKFCNIHGYTTATEMAFMGRYTISNAIGTFFKPYKDFDDIIKLIEVEKKKIGTMQKSVIGNYFNADKEWLNENFWL